VYGLATIGYAHKFPTVTFLATANFEDQHTSDQVVLVQEDGFLQVNLMFFYRVYYAIFN
jgi:hypothetical protein